MAKGKSLLTCKYLYIINGFDNDLEVNRCFRTLKNKTFKKESFLWSCYAITISGDSYQSVVLISLSKWNFLSKNLFAFYPTMHKVMFSLCELMIVTCARDLQCLEHW